MDNQQTIYVSPPHKRKQQTSSDEVWVTPPAKRKRPFLTLFLWLFGLGFVGLVCFGLLATLFYTSDWILPGTAVLGSDIGGSTQSEATAVLQANWQQRIIVLSDSQSNQQVNPEVLGMVLDAQATAAKAHEQGRSLASLQRMLSSGSLQVQPVWSYEPAVAEAYLMQLAASEIDVAPTNAGVAFENGRFLPTPPANGTQLDVLATMALIQQNPAAVLQNGRLNLVTQSIPPIVADTALVEAKIGELLTTAVQLHAFDPINNQAVDVSIAPDIWGMWLSLTADEVGQLNWELAEAEMSSFLQGQLSQLGKGRFVEMGEVETAVKQTITNGAIANGASGNNLVRTRIYHAPMVHIVQAGETLSSIGYNHGIPYPWIQQSNPNVANLSVGQAITIPSPDDLIPFPVVENKRIIVSISQQKVWAYENGALKWEWEGSTGIANSPTSPGIFQIQTHEVEAYAGNWDLHMPYFMGIYQPVPTADFMNGFHGFPTRDGYNLLWTGDLGRPVTYGCVLVSTENAEKLFGWAEQGVIVEIQR